MSARVHTARDAGRHPSALRLTRWLATLCMGIPALAQADAASDALIALHDGGSPAAWAIAAVPQAPLVLSNYLAIAAASGSTTGTVALAAEQNHFPAPGLARPAWAGASSTTPITSASRPWHSARLVEIPRDATPGLQQHQYVRPRYALGFQSHGLKQLLTNIGMDPHACLAPIVRLRTKVSNGGDVSGTFWLAARCSFR
jgi:hypothetical protein